MKEGIHPEYTETTITCVCGNVIKTRSSKKDIKVEICSNCHPFMTGKQKIIDTAGRVERFQKSTREKRRAATRSKLLLRGRRCKPSVPPVLVECSTTDYSLCPMSGASPFPDKRRSSYQDILWFTATNNPIIEKAGQLIMFGKLREIEKDIRSWKLCWATPP